MAQAKHIYNNVKILVGTSLPVDGTSGTGAKLAGPGSLYVREHATLPGVWVNRGTKASPAWELPGRIFMKGQAGKNGAGALTLTGAKVGDKVRNAMQITDTIGDVTSSFESVITVADQIQQSAATDLSIKVILFTLQRA